jgi:hypothetical protein
MKAPHTLRNVLDRAYAKQEWRKYEADPVTVTAFSPLAELVQASPDPSDAEEPGSASGVGIARE